MNDLNDVLRDIARTQNHMVEGEFEPEPKPTINPDRIYDEQRQREVDEAFDAESKLYPTLDETP